MNRLIYRNKAYTGETRDLLSASASIGDALAAESLSVDTLTARVLNYDTRLLPLAADGKLLAAEGVLLAAQTARLGLDKSYRYGEPVWYYHGEDLIGKFYVESIPRTGREAYQLKAVSAVGLLRSSYYYGGIYNGISLAELAADIIRGIIAYRMDPALGETILYGLIRKKSRRDALLDTLFAAGAMIEKDETGLLSIVPQKERTPYGLEETEIYMGGSVAGDTPATQISVTEHSFAALPGDTLVTLFDGEAAAEVLVTPMGEQVRGVLVEFDEPAHDLQAANGVILESGANYAVLGPSSSVTLTGKQYTHTQRVLTKVLSDQGTPNVIQSSACELVSLLNAENVLKRLEAYYGHAVSYQMDLVVTHQKPGDAVTFVDPFGEAASGYIRDLDITMSGILKGSATIVSGYIPTASGNYYEHVAVLTEDTDFVMPPECKGKARVVVIGGGDGGGLGSPGKEGGKASADKYGAAGEGGAPGTPGNGGKIYVETIQASPGQRFAVKIGPGGKGATLDAEAEPGGETTFGALSSADGRSAAEGYVNLFDGSIYGDVGISGIPGGRGSGAGETGTEVVPGEDVEYKGVIYRPGEQGESGHYSSYYGLGGLGGGAAAGAPGGNGERGYVNSQPFANGGEGGDGAVPVKADDGLRRGQGGGAGHGGGGGGGGGPAKGPDSSSTWYGQGGSGGDGGEGGDGAPGMVLVYY
ncbi:hypothetical protein I4200191B4_17930 [Pseudoflavonifractor gallinarum]|uniref:hypothetical protein n=1 Tax=Pseudoflavonifractor gallinarum TaxID=2779352 RepID=UPI0036F2D5B8